ncbi:MAG: hypothetical protein ACR2RF_05945 [Geminicoccaceae bacterium]
MTDRFPEMLFQALDSSGVTLSGAKLNFYITGTSTRKDTYSDSAKTTPNANPVVADSAGRFGDIFMDLDVQYRCVYTDSADVTITTLDNVSPVRQNPVPSITTSAKSTDYTVLTTDKGFLILVDASSGAVTVTLPAAATAADGFFIYVLKTDSSTNAVTIDGDGAETIDGQTTLLLGNQHEAALVVTNGTAWFAPAKKYPPDIPQIQSFV